MAKSRDLLRRKPGYKQVFPLQGLLQTMRRSMNIFTHSAPMPLTQNKTLVTPINKIFQVSLFTQIKHALKCTNKFSQLQDNLSICLKWNTRLDVLAEGRLRILSLHTFQCKTEAQCWSKGGDWKRTRPHITVYFMVIGLSLNQTCREGTAGKRLKNCFKDTTALAVW